MTGEETLDENINGEINGHYRVAMDAVYSGRIKGIGILAINGLIRKGSISGQMEPAVAPENISAIGIQYKGFINGDVDIVFDGMIDGALEADLDGIANGKFTGTKVSKDN
jgi:hypothetical protein